MENIRPSIVVDEATSQGVMKDEVVVENAFNKVTGMSVKMSREFEPQWSAAYMSRCFPWSLNYASGGADYPPLFQRRVEVGADANADGYSERFGKHSSLATEIAYWAFSQPECYYTIRALVASCQVGREDEASRSAYSRYLR